MLDITLLIQQIINGLLLGCLYSLMGLGLALIFGVMRVVNFAHGDMIVMGVYILSTLYIWFNIPIILLIPLYLFMFFILGLIINKCLLEYPRLRESDGDSSLIITYALSIILESAMLSIWGAYPFSSGFRIEGTLSFFGISIGLQRITSSIIAIFGIIILFLFLKLSMIGKAIRAVSQNAQLAWTLGINAHRIYKITFGLSVVLAAVAGGLLAPMYAMTPYQGAYYLTKSFAVVIIGGMGNLIGTILAALLLGTVESLSVFVIKGGFRDVIGLLLMIIILFFKHEGLLGKEVRV